MSNLEYLKQEIEKCVNNPIYFCENYVYISHPIRGKIKFELYPFQRDVLKSFKEFDYNIILKSRQLGISTLVAAYSLWLILFHDNKNILVIATKQDVAKNLISKVQFAYDCLPDFLKISFKENNKLSIRLINNSGIKAETSASASGRSESLSLLIIDEAAFIPNAEEIWLSAQQTLATGGRAIILSTPNGVGNFFHKLWLKAESGSNDYGLKFNAIKLPWHVHPERDEKWRVQQEILLGEKGARQECDASFENSSNTLIPFDVIKSYFEKIPKEIYKKEFGGDLLYFKAPEKKDSYILGADVARGDGSDYSAFHVLNVETLEQVCEFKGKIGTVEYASIIKKVAEEYNKALVVVENANIGWSVLQELIKENYENIYYSTKENIKYYNDKIINKLLSEKETNKIPGFTTSSSTRPLIINKMENYINSRDVIINSQRLLRELETFVYENGKAQAMRGYNDDLVIAYAITLWIRDLIFALKEYKPFADNIIKNNNAMLENSNVITNKNYKNPYIIKIKNSYEDLRWLL